MADSGQLGVILTFAGVLITAVLAAFTALRTGKNSQERSSDRRKIEEETTDIVLKRVREELKRAYAVIDKKNRIIRRMRTELTQWIESNRDKFIELGITRFPNLSLDEDDEDDQQVMDQMRL